MRVPRRITIITLSAILVLSCAMPISLHGQGRPLDDEGTASGTTLAVAKAYERAVSVYPEIATRRVKLSEHVVAPPGYPIGQPAFSLKPGESVDVLDIFPNDSESGYTCKIRNNSGRIGFLICDNIRMLEWRGDRGSLVRMLVDEPYEYESSYLDRKELIEKLDAYIAKNPSGRFVPFAELEIISAKCNVAMDAMQNVWTEVRGIREQEVGVRIGTRINPRWSPEASQLYTALAKQEPEVLQGLLDLCKLVGKLQSLVPSPISLAEEQ